MILPSFASALINLLHSGIFLTSLTKSLNFTLIVGGEAAKQNLEKIQEKSL